MSLRAALQRLARRDPATPNLRERAAGLRASLARIGRRPEPAEAADQGRRAVMVGSLAAAMPLTAATRAVANPDAELLSHLAAFLQAREAEAGARRRYRIAWDAVSVVLMERPSEMTLEPWECAGLLGPLARRSWGVVNPRWTPPRDDVESSCFVWTGASLRQVIERAVPALGRGGQTPHLIRRWKGLLASADAFDAQVSAVEERVSYHRLKAEKAAAEVATTQERAAIGGCVARTPEGLAALVSVIAECPWKDAGGAWPNLLRSAANVAGVDPASLEHEYASTRRTS